MTNDGDAKYKGFFEKYWWAICIGVFLIGNMVAKNNFRDVAIDECLEKGLSNCPCLATEITRRHGPVYLHLYFTGGRPDGREIGKAAARYCAIGG